MHSLWELDQAVFRSIQGLRTPWLDPLVQLITCSGLGWVQVALIVILFADWRSIRTPRAAIGVRAVATLDRTRFLLPLLLAYATSGLANQVVKNLIERDRPSNLPWVNALEDVHYNSFVSGHTATAFGLASALYFMSRGTSWAKAGSWAWLWAGLVGFSRMYVGVHWPTDVLGGAAVGIVSGAWISWLCRPREAEVG